MTTIRLSCSSATLAAAGCVETNEVRSVLRVSDRLAAVPRYVLIVADVILSQPCAAGANSTRRRRSLRLRLRAERVVTRVHGVDRRVVGVGSKWFQFSQRQLGATKPSTSLPEIHINGVNGRLPLRKVRNTKCNLSKLDNIPVQC